MKLVPVDGFSGLCRDVETGAVININSQEAESARDRKRIRAAQKQHAKEMDQKVCDMADEISQLKSLVKQLIEKQ